MPQPSKVPYLTKNSLSALALQAFYETLFILGLLTGLISFLAFPTIFILCAFPSEKTNLPRPYPKCLALQLGLCFTAMVKVYGASYLVAAPVYIFAMVTKRRNAEAQHRPGEPVQMEIVGQNVDENGKAYTAEHDQCDDDVVVADE